MKCHRRHPLRLLLACLIMGVLVTGCQSTTPPETLPSPASSITIAEATPTPMAISPSSTPLPQSSPTARPTTEDTVAVPTLTATAYAPDSKALSRANADRLQEVARYGTGAANEIALSSDGLLLGVATDIGAYFYNSLNFQLLHLIPTSYPVRAIIFSPDNQFVALAQYPNRIQVFQRYDFLEVAQLFFSIEGLPDDYTISGAFTPDSSLLISAARSTDDLIINRWNTGSWRPLGVQTFSAGEAAFFNQQAGVYGVLDDTNLNLLSLYYPEDVRSVSLPTDLPESYWEKFIDLQEDVTPSTDGGFLILNSGSSVTHWQISSETTSYQLTDYPRRLPDPCYQAPNSCLNTAGGYSWECEESTPSPPIETTAMTPDNIMMLISLNTGKSEFRRASDGQLAWEINAHFTDLSFSPGGEFFFGLKPDGVIEKRSTVEGNLLNSMHRHPQALFALAYSPDGTVLAGGYSDGWIRFFDTNNGQELGVLFGTAQSLQFSPDGQYLAAGLSDGIARIFDLEKRQYDDLQSAHQGAVTDLQFSPGSSQLLTGSKDCTARLWDVTNRNLIETIYPDRTDPFQITGVEQAPAAQIPYFIGNRSGIYIWGENDPQEVLLPEEHQLNDIGFSPDGSTFALTGDATWLLQYDAEEGLSSPEALTFYTDNAGKALRFSPDSTTLIIATNDSLEIYDTLTKSLLATYPYKIKFHQNDETLPLDISSNGMQIAVGGQNGMIHIFAIP